MSYQKDPDLNDGETAVCLGDTGAKWGHLVKPGTEVILIRYDSSDNSWLCSVDDGHEGAREAWIGQDDLESGFEPVTDDEIADLFGLKRED